MWGQPLPPLFRTCGLGGVPWIALRAGGLEVLANDTCHAFNTSHCEVFPWLYNTSNVVTALQVGARMAPCRAQAVSTFFTAPPPPPTGFCRLPALFLLQCRHRHNRRAFPVAIGILRSSVVLGTGLCANSRSRARVRGRDGPCDCGY